MELLPIIPQLTITDIKKQPMSGFDLAEEKETGVYVTKNGVPVGVVLTKEQYETLVSHTKDLEEQLEKLKA